MVAKAIVQTHHMHKLLHFRVEDGGSLFACGVCASYSATRVVALREPCDGRPKNITHHNKLKKCQHPANKDHMGQPDGVWSRAQVQQMWPHVHTGEGTESTPCLAGTRNVQVPSQSEPGPSAGLRASWLQAEEWEYESEPGEQAMADEYAYWADGAA